MLAPNPLVSREAAMVSDVQRGRKGDTLNITYSGSSSLPPSANTWLKTAQDGCCVTSCSSGAFFANNLKALLAFPLLFRLPALFSRILTTRFDCTALNQQPRETFPCYRFYSVAESGARLTWGLCSCKVYSLFSLLLLPGVTVASGT